MDNQQRKQPQLDSHGFVVSDWRNQNRQTNRIEQPGFLQTIVMKAWSAVWSPISRVLGVGKHPPQNQLKIDIRDNIRNIEPEYKRTHIFRKCQYTHQAGFAARSQDDMLNTKNIELSKVEQATKSLPVIEPSPISYAELQELVNDHDISYTIRRVDNVDMYELHMNAQMTCVYDTNGMEIPLDLRHPFVVNDVIRILKKKDHKKRQRIKQNILDMRREIKEMHEKQRIFDRQKEKIIETEQNRLNQQSEGGSDSGRLLLAPHPSSASSSFARPDPKMPSKPDKNMHVPIHISPFYQQTHTVNELPQIELSPIHPIPNNILNPPTPSSSEQLSLRAQSSFPMQSSPFLSSEADKNPFLMDLIRMADKKQTKQRNTSTAPKKKKVERVDD